MNARDLATLGVDPGRFAAVRQALPAGTVLVAESGIRDRAGVQAAADAGADAVLVGETLVRPPIRQPAPVADPSDWRSEMTGRREALHALAWSNREVPMAEAPQDPAR